MISVLKVNKSGNKITGYECTDGNKVSILSKQQLATYIQNKQVSNATMQVYKGQVIIRVKDASTKSVNKTNSSNTASISTETKSVDKTTSSNTASVSTANNQYNKVALVHQPGKYVYISNIQNGIAINIPDDINKIGRHEIYAALDGKWPSNLMITGGNGLTDISYMLQECSSQNVDLSSLYTQNIHNAIGLFFHTLAVENIDISSLDTNKLKLDNIKGMFNLCGAHIIRIKANDKKLLGQIKRDEKSISKMVLGYRNNGDTWDIKVG